MQNARYEILAVDNSFYGEIPGFHCVWANAPTRERRREELKGVLEGWILLRFWLKLPLPSFNDSD